MKKPYLLIAGWNYYPSAGTKDWIACFETYEEAESRVIKTNTLSDEDIEKIYEHDDNVTLKSNSKFMVDNNFYDWYNIIDLRNWTS